MPQSLGQFAELSTRSRKHKIGNCKMAQRLKKALTKQYFLKIFAYLLNLFSTSKLALKANYNIEKLNDGIVIAKSFNWEF